MSEKQVKRLRFMRSCPRLLAEISRLPSIEPRDDDVPEKDDFEADLWRYAFMSGNRTGKTFASAGLALDDDGELVVVDPTRLLGIERKDSE